MPRLLVAGPPCAGKTTFARENLRPGETLLDYDDLTEVRYTHDPAAYREWVRMVPTSDVVVWSAPRRRQRGMFRSKYGAEIVVLLPPIAVCVERAEKERPPSWRTAVLAWFSAWEPSRTGERIIR